MKYKKVLRDFISNNEEILKELDQSIGKFRDIEDADKILPKLTEAVEKFKYNPAFGTFFAGMLLLSSNKEVDKTISLEEIEELYQSLLVVQEYNLETYLSTAYFEYNQMEDIEEAKMIIQVGIEKAEEKISELKELLFEIESL